jgi:hypothetical protein
MAKAVKKSVKTTKVKGDFTMPGLLGLAVLLGLLAILPWATSLDGSSSLHALQLALALLLALVGGFLLGLQVASTRKK